MKGSAFYDVGYMNKSNFANGKYMNRMGFVILGRSSTPI